MNQIKTKRPVTQSGWYETEDGQAAYFLTGGMSKDGSTGVRCTEIRSKDSVRCLIECRPDGSLNLL